MRLTITLITLLFFSAFGHVQGIGGLKNAFGGGDDSSCLLYTSDAADES